MIFIDCKDCSKHYDNDPESSDRLEAVRSGAESVGVQIVDNDRRATGDELELVHTRRRVEQTKRASNRGWSRLGPEIEGNEHTYDSSALAVGAVLEAIDRVVEGSVSHVFCNVRPPGHHSNQVMHRGFCVFNSVAVGARYAQSKGFERVAIVDWDVHHGNGTETIFRKDSTVFYGSIHMCGYPGTGSDSRPEYQTFNHMLRNGVTYDDGYSDAFDLLLGELRLFDPKLVLISCGFDAHIDDPYGDFSLESEDFGKLTKSLMRVCPLIVSVLEGGYNFEAIEESTVAHLTALM